MNNNDLMKLILSCTDENGDCNAREVIEKSGMTEMDFLHSLKSLQAHGLVDMTDLSELHVYQQAYDAYIRPEDKVKSTLSKASKLTLKKLVEIVVGVTIGVITAFVIYFFGWQ